MKRAIPVIILLAILSAISGILMSDMNFIGRLGVNIVHREYKFLKIWWQGALAVFTTLLILFAIQSILKMKLSKSVSSTVQIVLFFAALGGLYLTYDDFRHDFTHKIIGERIHLGVYLFWVGWMIVSLFHLFSNRTAPQPKIGELNKV